MPRQKKQKANRERVGKGVSDFFGGLKPISTKPTSAYRSKL